VVKVSDSGSLWNKSLSINQFSGALDAGAQARQRITYGPLRVIGACR
jgi:hypothetical protein